MDFRNSLTGNNIQYNPTDSKKFKSGNCGIKIVVYDIANPMIVVINNTLSTILILNPNICFIVYYNKYTNNLLDFQIKKLLCFSFIKLFYGTNIQTSTYVILNLDGHPILQVYPLILNYFFLLILTKLHIFLSYNLIQ